MKRKLLVVGAILAVAVASAATYAFATSNADAVIHACVAKDGGLRVVDPNDACKKNESALQWNEQGQTGPQGAPGAPGAQGPAGSAGPAGSSAASPDAISATAAIVGQKSGAIVGKSGAIAGDGPNGKIMVIAVSHEIVSPRDAASGLPTGKRQHKPFTIRKELDKSTPLLYSALVTNENLSSATFTYQRNGAPFMTVKLTNANISDIAQSGGSESVSFTYQKIQWTWIDGGITAEDDWESPVS